MINKLILLLLLLFSFSFSNAQKFELGKVSIAELEQKEHPIDTNAEAAILFNIGNTYFEDATTITKVITRIKIYNKEGYSFANKEVLHFLGESVSFSDAVTYNLVNGVIEKTKLKSDGVFDQKIDKYISQKKITMPNVKIGSILEYKYEIRTPGYSTPKDWYFQSSIPVDYSEYNFLIPNGLNFNKQIKGYIFPKVTIEGKYNDDANTKYILQNIPAMKEESFINNIDNYKASVTFELAMINIPGWLYKEYSTDWASVTKTINKYEDFGPELNKTGYFENDITSLIKGITSRDEIIAAIFNYVKSSIKWDGYYSYSCNKGVKTAYKNKTGNVAEINLMLTSMLRYAGISVNPVLVSTRSNGIALFPSRNAFNYVIAAVEIENDLILLDATEKYALPNILPVRDLNWYGRLIRKDGTSAQVDLMPKFVSKEVDNLSFSINKDQAIEGKIRKQLTDYKALEFRQNSVVSNKEVYLEGLETANNNIEVSDYVRENDLDLALPIVETYSFKDNNHIEIINDKMYIAPMLFLTAKENPFKQEKREYPVDFSYPKQEKININIDIPEGYKVETLPTTLNLTTDDNIGVFKYVVGITENKIQISVTFAMYFAIVSSDYYEVIKDFYQKMIDKQNEKIVLVKK